MVTVTSDIAPGAWDGFVEAHPHGSVDHLWGWKSVIERVFGHRTLYVAAMRGGRVSGVLPLVLFRSALFGRFAVSLPFLNDGGVLADDTETASALLAHATGEARTFGASHVELRHRARQFEALPHRNHKLGLTRPLPATAEELWTSLDRKVRNQVRKAQKESLVAVSGGLELLDEFYPIFAENMRDLGTPVYSRALFRAVLETFPSRARVFVVRHSAVPAAAGVAISARGSVLVPWASSLRRFRQLCPNMLLYWSMLEHAIAIGASRFDFGRSSPDSGTHQFKVQWGATAEPLHWEYVMLRGGEPPDQGPRNPKYQKAIDLWARLPLPLANLCGPAIVRHIP